MVTQKLNPVPQTDHYKAVPTTYSSGRRKMRQQVQSDRATKKKTQQAAQVSSDYSLMSCLLKYMADLLRGLE